LIRRWGVGTTTRLGSGGDEKAADAFAGAAAVGSA
jgi:hypothetical protein